MISSLIAAGSPLLLQDFFEEFLVFPAHVHGLFAFFPATGENECESQQGRTNQHPHVSYFRFAVASLSL